MREEITLRRARSCFAVSTRAMAVLAITASLHGCVGALFAPRPASVPELMLPDTGAPAMRALQMRRFDHVPEQVLQAAGMSVIQDLGYQVTLSDAKLGLIIGTRGRQGFIEGLAEAESDYFKWFFSMGYIALPPPGSKVFNGTSVVVVIRPALEQGGTGNFVRVQFFRFLQLHPTKQLVVWADAINNEDDYNRFFTLLSSAAALEAKKK